MIPKFVNPIVKIKKITPLLFGFIFLAFAFLNSCAYKLSNNVDKLPGGVTRVQVPIFENDTKEPNIEVYFTNSLKTEILRFGRVSMVNDESQAQAILKGKITGIEITSDESVIESKDTKFLPYGTVLATQVKVLAVVTLTMVETKTEKVLWSSEFKQYKYYTPPQITLPVINSANNLYNLSERRQTLDSLSKDMMQLAFDRLVDNF